MEKTQELWDKATAELIRSNVDSRHPFKLMVLATIGKFPEVRTVVKRDFDKNLHFWIYTDSRSPKINNIKVSPNASLLLYDQRKKLQIRVVGKLKVHTRGEKYEHHLILARNQPGDYQSNYPPGTSIPVPDQNKKGKELHFCLLEFIPECWDILQLADEYHFRARYEISGHEMKASWLVP